MSVHLHVNFLAHFLLSGTDRELLIGNFIADAVKGSRYNDYPPGIRKGILLHRHIDHYTDTHEVVKESKHRLWPDFRHYAPVIVDVFYDHFLATNWEIYHNLKLDLYAADVYTQLEQAHEYLPDKPKYMLPFMKKHDWLSAYAHVEGIHHVLTGMSKRTPYSSGMEKASFALTADYNLYRNEFELFFPQLQLSAQNFIDSYQEV